MIYLGQLGRMIGVKCPASQQVQYEDRYTFKATLGGVKKGQVKPRAPRTWSLQTSDATTPPDIAALMQFASGAWGNGPFWFVSADAPFTNLLTPAGAELAPGEYVLTSGLTVTEGAPLLTPDGWASRSIIKSTNNGLFLGKDMLPVLPGMPLTAAAYVRGAGGCVQITWYDSAGSVISTAYSAVTPGATGVVRSWMTRTPPSNAVSCRVGTNSAAAQVAWPTLTWTDKLMPYSDGQGCPKAVVHAPSRSLVLTGPDRTYSNLSYTVTEVG